MCAKEHAFRTLSCVVEHDISTHPKAQLVLYGHLYYEVEILFHIHTLPSPFQARLINGIYKGVIENCTILFALSVVIL